MFLLKIILISMQTNRAVPPQGRTVYYRQDGTGRDTYIQSHNGGLLSKDRIHQLNQPKTPHEPKFTFSRTKYGKHPYEYNKGGSNKFVHYISDGSGRDFYIGSTEGGNSHPHRWRNQTQYYFRNTLRDSRPLPKTDPENSDTFTKSQSRMVGTGEKFHRTMSFFQQEQSRRLSQSKKYRGPPPVRSYFQPGMDASRQFRKKSYSINS